MLYGCSHLVEISEVRHLWFTVVAFFHPFRGVKNKWGERAMFNVKNTLFIGSLVASLVVASSVTL